MKHTRWIALLLALVMVLGLMPNRVSAAEIVGEGACGEEGVRWTLDSNGKLTITGKGMMDDWAYSGPEFDMMPWEPYADDVLEVVINEGITHIGSYAFSGCHNLGKVTIPSTVTSIGDGAFFDCDGFTSFVIPDTVKELGKSVLRHCSYLKEVKLPKGITKIPESMFKDCIALVEYVVPGTVTSIGGSAFASCFKLKSVTLPDGITEIPYACFEYCEALENVNIPATVKSVEDYAFRGCIKLKSLEFPEGLQEIGSDVFSNCSKLTSITIPASVTKLRHTFENATDMETVKFLGHPPAFASSTFGSITVTAYYPNNFGSWTEDVLRDYGGTVTWVGYKSSADPGDILNRGSCGENATWTLKTDGTLIISGSGEISGSTDIPWRDYEARIKKVEIQSGITVIGDYAFQDLVNMESLSIADTVQVIGMYSFDKCQSLKKLDIPNGVTNIMTYAFSSCTSLTSVTMADSVIALDRGAFAECTNLSQVKLSNNLQTLERSTFYKCSALKTIVLPDTLTELTLEVFSGSGLEEILIPESIAVIDGWAFNGTPLKSITIPASVSTLGASTFSGCEQLRTIYFDGAAPTIGSNCFKNVTATVYYSGDLEGWNDDILQDYGGDLTWVSTHTHSYTSVVTAPTCTEQGYTTYTCSGCGNSYKDNYVDALGHAYGEPEFIGRDEGHSYTCTRCGEVKTESCTFDAGTVVKEATLDEFGVKKHTCTVCGGSYETGDVYRIYGEDRVETALAAAELLKETLGIEKFNAVIITDGDNFADALTGSYLAARKDAPILLYRAKGVAMNEEYIRNNLSADGIIYILGGTAAVPAEVETSLRDQGYTVVRLAGDSRFDTNLAILEEAGLEGDEILVCTGWEFADSLSASATGMPILMVNTRNNKLTEGQIAFLQAHADKNYTVIGGNVAVSEGLLEAIDAQTDGTVSRLYGDSREETSVKVAMRYFDSPAYALVAYSRNFPDGLCGGPLAHAMNAPLLLVNKKTESAAAAYVAELGIAKGAILGGTAAVSDASGRIVFGLE